MLSSEITRSVRRGASRSRKRFPHAPARCEGFTLLEVLIAVLVMAIGLLGLAALQASTVQFNRSAHFRSQATSLGYEIADRMRANRDAALGGAYDVDYADPPPACAAAGGDTVAERDVAAWHMAIACALPQGNGSIELLGDGVVRISVSWSENETLSEDGSELFEMTTAL